MIRYLGFGSLIVVSLGLDHFECLWQFNRQFAVVLRTRLVYWNNGIIGGILIRVILTEN